MNIQIEEFRGEIEDLVAFLTAEAWPFHGVSQPKPEQIRENHQNGTYDSGDCKTFWILGENGQKAGFIRFYDLEDGTPLFDLRLSYASRAAGMGTAAVKWAVGHIFSAYPDKVRIEGNTRRDNYAMRGVFHKCGFIKEAHFRKAWPDEAGTLHDAIGYGILREDWESGSATPVDWNDYEY